MSRPDETALTFSALQPLIFKAKREGITLADFIPLADYMQGSVILKQFEEMLQKSIVWRDFEVAPRPAKKEENGGTADPAAGGDDGAGAPAAADENSYDKQVEAGPTYRELTSKAEVAAAIASSKDRIRLYVSQDYSLMYLVLRLTIRHQLLAVFLGLCRTATVILQVWALWTVIRFVNHDPEYDYSTGVQYVVALMLPIGSLLQSWVQQNCFQVATRAALIARTAVTVLLYEKLRNVTPQQLGQSKKAGGASATAAKSTAASPRATDEAKEDDAAKNNNAPISTGQLINLVSSDANAIVEALIMGPPSLMSIVDIITCIVWIGWVSGWTAAPLTGAVLIVLGFQIMCGKIVGRNKTRVAQISDQRQQPPPPLLPRQHHNQPERLPQPHNDQQ